MNIRRTATVLGTVAFGTATLLSTGIAHADQVSGSGTKDDPYIAPCSSEPTDDPDGFSCLVNSFAARTLKALANEYVPVYQCPAERPWLVNENYAPVGTTLLKGVEVQGLGPIGVSITGGSREDRERNTYGYHATGAGFPFSSAQNWSLGEQSYKVILHCTSNWDKAKHAGRGA